MRWAVSACLLVFAGCAVLDPLSDLQRESPGGLIGDSGTGGGEASSVDVGPSDDGSTGAADGSAPTGKLAFTVTALAKEPSSIGGGPMVAFAPNGDAVLAFSGHDEWTIGGATFAAPDAGRLDFAIVRVDAKGALKLARRYDLGLMENVAAVAVDANDGIWFAGYRYAVIDETSPISALVGKLDAAGNVLFTAPLTASASTPTASWFSSRAIRVGKGGEVVLVANYRGTIGWTNADGSLGTVSSSNSSGIPVNTDDVFVARLDPSNGRVMWWKTIGGADLEFVWDVAVDAKGDVYLAAQIESASLAFPAVTRVGGRMNALVTKLSGADGSAIWARVWGDSIEPPVKGPDETDFAASKSSVAAHAIAVDEKGHVVVGGNARGTVDFGGVTTSALAPGFFVTMLDAQTGNATWMRDGRGTHGNGGQVQGVGIDEQGYVVALAVSKSTSAGGTGSFAGQSFSTAGIGSVFAAKLGVANGNVVWTKTVVATGGNGAGNAAPYGVAVAPSGRSLAGLVVRGTADLGNGTPVSAPAFAAMVGWDP